MSKRIGWSWREATGEAWRNIGLHSLPQLLLCLLVFATVGVGTYTMVSSTLSREQLNQRNGAYVWVASSARSQDSPTTMRAEPCARLVENTGVLDVGYVSGSEQPLLLSPFPGGPSIPSRFVSPSMPAIFDSDRNINGPVAGSDLVKLGLVSPGQLVSLDNSVTTLKLDNLVADEMPIGALNSSILLPQAAIGDIDECYLRMDRAHYHLGKEILAAAFSPSGASIVPFRDSTLDLQPADQFRGFLLLLPGMVAGLALGVFLVVLTVAKRAKIMVYRLIGTRRATLAYVLTCEASLVMLPALAIAIPTTWVAGIWIHGTTHASQSMLVSSLQMLATLLTAIVTYILGSIAIAGGNPVLAAQDR